MEKNALNIEKVPVIQLKQAILCLDQFFNISVLSTNTYKYTSWKKYVCRWEILIVTTQESHIPLETEIEMKTGYYYIPLHGLKIHLKYQANQQRSNVFQIL